MSIIKTCIASLLVLSSFSLIAQESVNEAHAKNDLGIFFNLPQGMPSLEYRIVLNDNYKLRFGIDHIIENNTGYFSQIVFASDSSVTSESQNIQSLKPSLRMGFDRQLSIKYLSVGADVQIRYTQQKINFTAINSQLNENGDWESTFMNNNLPLKPPLGRRVTNHYLMPALRGNITAQFPLGDRFLLSVYYAATIGTNIFIAETHRNGSESELPAATGYTIDFDSFSGVGVRYLFSGK